MTHRARATRSAAARLAMTGPSSRRLFPSSLATHAGPVSLLHSSGSPRRTGKPSPPRRTKQTWPRSSSALDDRRDISAGELERLEGDVLRHGRGMPDKLQRRYATRFRSAATVRSRRLRIIVAAVSIAVVVLGVFGYFEYRNSAARSRCGKGGRDRRSLGGEARL